jgi:hypothetical protein
VLKTYCSLFCSLGRLPFITLLGALGKPSNWGRRVYLVLFFVLVVVDVPVLLLLYVTPTSSSNFIYLDLASDLAVIAFGAAWAASVRQLHLENFARGRRKAAPTKAFEARKPERHYGRSTKAC